MDKNNKNTNNEITDSQIFWYKNKSKIIIASVSAVALLITGVAIWFILNQKTSDEDTKFISDEKRIADYLIVPNNDSITLNQSKLNEKEGKYIYTEVDKKTADKNNIYSTSNDLNSLYTLNTNSKKVTQFVVDNTKLSEKDIVEYKGDLALEKFKYADDVLVGLSKEYLVIQHKDAVETIKLDKEPVNFLVAENKVLYAIDSKLYSYNVEDKKTISISLDKDIQDIEFINNQVIVLSSFGETNKTSTLASFKISDLYSTGLTTIKYTDSIALQNSNSNVDFYLFSKSEEKNAITTVTVSNEILKVEKLGGTFDEVNEKDVGKNGYAYLIKENKISIIDVSTGSEAGSLDINTSQLVVPVFF